MLRGRSELTSCPGGGSLPVVKLQLIDPPVVKCALLQKSPLYNILQQEMLLKANNSKFQVFFSTVADVSVDRWPVSLNLSVCIPRRNKNVFYNLLKTTQIQFQTVTECNLK